MKRIISIILIISMSTAILCACKPAHIHEYGEWVITKEPTCGNNVGIMERVCGCGEKETAETRASLAHDYEATDVVMPTVEADGYTVYVCQNCGDIREDDAVEKLPTLREGMMVYFEDFDGLSENMSSDDIFRALGWKRLIKNGATEADRRDITRLGSQSNTCITLKAEDGEVIITNEEGRSFIQILHEDYMSEAAKLDYTVQLDMTFKSGNGWVSVAPRYFSSNGTNSCYASWRMTSTGYGLHEGQGTGGLLRAAMNVDTVRYSYSTVEKGWWCSRTEGYKDITVSNDPEAFIDRKLTVLIQIVRSDSGYSHKPTAAELGDTSKMTDQKAIEGFESTVLGFGYHLWVVDTNGQKILVSAFNPDSVYNNEPKVCTAENWAEWFGDGLAFAINNPASVAVDNIAVWTGLSDMPKDRSTKDYERLIYEDHSRPIPEDSSEEGIVIVKNGEGKLYLTIPENADRNVLYARDRMMFYIKERTGVTLPTGSAKGNAYELLIGDTGRAESEALKATLSKNQYGIKVEGNKIIVAASNDAFLYDAVDYLIENYFEKGIDFICTEEKTVFDGQPDVREVGDLDSFRYLFTESQRVNSVSLYKGAVKPCDGIKATQGGGTDGKYHYQAFVKKVSSDSEEHNQVRIGKFELKDYAPVKYSEIMELNHANDITYNGRLDKIVVCHCSFNGKLISLLDPETLTVSSRVELPCSFYSISYNHSRDMYVVGTGGQNLRYITSDFRFADKDVCLYTTLTANYTTQGICSDDNFIYCALWDSKGVSTPEFQNIITVYDWYGNFVGIINIDIGKIEPENISIVDGRIELLAYHGGKGEVFYICPTK